MSTVSPRGTAEQKTPPAPDDAGFSLLEVMVAISLLHVLLIALTTFYLDSGVTIRRHEQRQEASRVAAAAMEKVRALGGDKILLGRDKISVERQEQDVVPAAVPYLDGGKRVWGEKAADDAEEPVPVPTSAVTVSQSGIEFQQNWYVVGCWQVLDSTDCTKDNEGKKGAVPLLRVVVAVTWPDNGCAGGTCEFVTSTLVSAEPDLIYLDDRTRDLVKPDIFFLADTTGSMGKSLTDVAGNASKILDEISKDATEPRYGAGQYRDFPKTSFAYRTNVAIPTADDSGSAAKNAFKVWSPVGGGDKPEANLYALHKVVTDAKFRADSSRIVVWFGDAPGHDSVCTAVSGDGPTVTEASVTAELVAAKIKVIAISVTSGAANGLDGDPTFEADNTYRTCGISGKPGQGSRIAAATGGRFFKDVDPEDVSEMIITGISSLR
ncbi:prepilin-type N-terminal cleavage/methylation domain-containing protein [Actinoplanes sp. NPDC051859]|uniref:prepilin-type N-terminal cleavage/methylation domain-containing protein n=1 Tax=Actinoplanes sp. NPDC051859 TaxID=3363909 RepID=UPI0037BC7095